MKKRALSLFLSIVMMLGLMPVPARAAPGEDARAVVADVGTPKEIKSALNDLVGDVTGDKGFIVHIGDDNTWGVPYYYNGHDLDGKGKEALITAGGVFHAGSLGNMRVSLANGQVSKNGEAVTIKTWENDPTWRNSNIAYIPFAVSVLVPAHTDRTVRLDFNAAAARNSNGAAGYYVELFGFGRAYERDPVAGSQFVTGDTNTATTLNKGKTLQPNGISEGKRAYWDNKSGGSAAYRYFTDRYINGSDSPRWLTHYFGYYVGVGRSSSALGSYHHDLKTALKISCNYVFDQTMRAPIGGSAATVTPPGGSAENYKKLDEAIAAYLAAPGSTLRLNRNAASSEIVELNQPGTIDLNGKTWTTPGIRLLDDTTIRGGGTLSVQDDYQYREVQGIRVRDADLTLNDVTIDTTQSADNDLGHYGVCVYDGSEKKSNLILDGPVTIKMGTGTRHKTTGIELNSDLGNIVINHPPEIEASTDFYLTDGEIQLGDGCAIPGNTKYVVSFPSLFEGRKWIARGQNAVQNKDHFVPKNLMLIVDTSGTERVMMRCRNVSLDPAGGTAYGGKTAYTRADGTLLKLDKPQRKGFTFAGWYDGETQRFDADGQALDTSVVYEDGQQLTARWTGTTYTVTLDPCGGTLPEGTNTKQVLYLDTYGELPVPTRAGDDFVGWYTGTTDGTPVTEETVYTKTVSQTLYARWKPSATYTVKFNANGGYRVTDVQSYIQKDNPKYAKLPTASRQGYNFLGWFTNIEGGTPVNVGDAVDSSRTLYAHWEGATRTFNYNLDGGEFADGTPATVQCKTGEPIPSLPTPTKKGYTFRHWETNTGKTVKAGDVLWVTSGDTIYLTAVWGAEQYTVTFHSEGGTFTATSSTSDRNVKVSHGQKVERQAVTKAGYILQGWEQTQGQKNYWNFSTETVAGNMDLYAVWDVAKYGVTLNAGSGTFTDGEKTKELGTVDTYASLFDADKITVKSEYIPEREGYTFAGWFIGSTQVTAGMKVTSTTPLTAKWTTQKFKLKLEPNGGTLAGGTALEQDVSYGQKLTRPGVTKSGSTLTGWKKADGNFWDFANDTVEGDITLTAVWNTSVTLNAGAGTFAASEGGTPGSTKVFQTEGNTFADLFEGDTVKAEYTPTRETGYEFGGWSTDGTTLVTKDTLLTNIPLIAIWNGKKVTITFDVNGGNELSSEDKTKVCHVGKTYGTLPIPTKEPGENQKSTFIGWFTAAENGTQVKADSTVTWSATGTTLYAHWETKHAHNGQSFATGCSTPEQLKNVLDSTASGYLTQDITITAQQAVALAQHPRICLNGHKIIVQSSSGAFKLSPNTSASSPALYLYDCCGDGAIVGHDHSGSAFSSDIGKDPRIVMYGGTIKGFKTGISLNGYGTFTMNGGTITDNSGGGVVAHQVIMSGGEITGNGSLTSDSFGGVKISPNSENAPGRFTMTGGKITNNKAFGTGNTAGGVLFMRGSGNKDYTEFNMSNGEISGNEATTTGTNSYAVGGINASGAGKASSYNTDSFVISGGKITNNRAWGGTKPTGGVLSKSGQYGAYPEIYGLAYIYDNYACTDENGTDARPSNFQIGKQGDKINVSGTVQPSLKVGVTKYNKETGLFTDSSSDTNNINTASSCFIADVAGQYVVKSANSDALTLTIDPPEGQAPEHNHKLCGDPSCTDPDHRDSVPFKWLPSTREYWIGGEDLYLGVDHAKRFTMTEYTSGSNTYNLCLNGHKLGNEHDTNVADTGVDANVTANISDCQGGGTMDRFVIAKSGALNLYGGTVGYLDNSGTLKVYGGTVKTLYGNSEAVETKLYGGTVTNASINSNNSSTVDSDNGTFLLDGATVETLKFTGNVKNIELRSGSVGSVTMYTREVGSNRPYVTENHKLKLTGATVTGTITLTNAGQIQITNDFKGGPYTINSTSFPSKEGSTYQITSGWGKNSELADADPTNYFELDSTNASNAKRYITTTGSGSEKEVVVAYGASSPDDPGGDTPALPHKHGICGDKGCTTHGGDETFEPYTDISEKITGNVYLTHDLTGNTTIGTGATLCLNGHKLTGRIQPDSGAQVTICDCQGGGVVEAEGSSGIGGIITTSSNGTINLYGGTVNKVQGPVVHLYGGTVGDVVVNGSGRLYLEGANVTDTGTITLLSNSKIRISTGGLTGGPYKVIPDGNGEATSAPITYDWKSNMGTADPADYFVGAGDYAGYVPVVKNDEVVFEKGSGTEPGGTETGKVVIVLPGKDPIEIDVGDDGKITEDEVNNAVDNAVKPPEQIKPPVGQILDKDEDGNIIWVGEDDKPIEFPVDVPDGEEFVLYPKLKECTHPNAKRTNEVAGTCTTPGSAEIVCPDCEYTGTISTGLGEHAIGEGTWQSDDNIHWKVCSACQAMVDVENHTLIPQEGENAGTDPTCTDVGSKLYACETCGKSVTLEIPALGHDFSVPYNDGNAETHTFKCSRCTVTEVIDTDTTHREPHNIITEITKEPTATETGERTMTCECGWKKTETIPALGTDPGPVDPGEDDDTYSVDYVLVPAALEQILTAPPSTQKKPGDGFMVGVLTGSRLGYTFEGWQADSDGKTYAAGAAFTMPDSPVLFTAQWQRQTGGTPLTPGDKLILDDGTVVENKGGDPETVIEVDRDGDGIPEIVITLPEREGTVTVTPTPVPTDTDGDGIKDIDIDKEIIDIPGGTKVETNITPPGDTPDPNKTDSTITVGPGGGTVDLDGEVTGGVGTTVEDEDGNKTEITEGEGTIDPDGTIDLPGGGTVETDDGEEIVIPPRKPGEEPGYVEPDGESEQGGGTDDGKGDEDKDKDTSAKPVITEQPKSPGTLTEGEIPEGTKLTVEVEDPANDGEITYQWYTDDPDRPGRRIPIPGATHPDYEIPEDLEPGVHHYYCEVTNTEPGKNPTKVTTDEVTVRVKPEDTPGGEKVPLKPGETVEVDTDGDGEPDIIVKRDEDGDTVTIDNDGDGKPDITITVPTPPTDGDVTVDKETGEVTVPDGSTVDSGNGKPEIELPDGGKVDPEDGGVISEEGGSVVIPGGGDGGEDITITPPGTGDDDDRKVTPNPDGTIDVPGGTTIDPGDDKHEVELPDGGKVDPDDGGVIPNPGGGVVIPGGGDGGEDITITPPGTGDDDDRKVTQNPDGTIDVPGGSTVDTGGDKPEVKLPDGGKVDPDDGGVIPGPGGSVVVPGGGDGGEDITITPPKDGDDDDRKVTPNPDGTIDVPGGTPDNPEGTTVNPGGKGPDMQLPDGGKIDTEDGSIIPGPGGSVVLPGGDGKPEITVTPPTDGDDDDRKLIPNPDDGTVKVPEGSEISTDDVTVEITEDSPGPGDLDPDGVITFPDGGKVTIDKGEESPTEPIEIPEGGSISIGDDATDISGDVTDDGVPVADAQVTIQRGRTIMQRTKTNAEGKFRLYNIPRGVYNLVAVKGDRTVIKLVTLTGEDQTGLTLRMHSDTVNSVLEVKPDETQTPTKDKPLKVEETVVGGLDEEAEAVKQNHPDATSVTVTMTVKREEEHTADGANEIRNIAQAIANMVNIEFLSIKVERTVVQNNATESEELRNTNTILEIVIPFDFTGKRDVKIHRYHDYSAETLEEIGSHPGSTFREGTFWSDIRSGVIHVYTNKFSTYAASYTEESASHTHIWGEDWHRDSSGHWKVCTVCGEPSETEAHVFNGNVCSICGYTRRRRPSSGSSGSGTSVDSTPEYPPIIPRPDHGTVTTDPARPEEDDKVTITVTPDPGYQVDEVTVTGPDGDPVPVIDNGDGTYTFTQPDGRVTIRVEFSAVSGGGSYDDCPQNASCPIARFDDASPTEWYHNGVHYCMENGLMVGITDTTFRPGQETTRVMIAAILWRLEGSPAANGGRSTRFSDVPDNVWYTDAVEWAASANIVSGYSNGTFGPDDRVTREQLAAMLWRYATYKGYDVSVGESTNILSYQDVGMVSDWAVPALQWAVGSGISVGKAGNRLDPQGFSTRAEAASMLQRFCIMPKAS